MSKFSACFKLLPWFKGCCCQRPMRLLIIYPVICAFSWIWNDFSPAFSKPMMKTCWRNKYTYLLIFIYLICINVFQASLPCAAQASLCSSLCVRIIGLCTTLSSIYLFKQVVLPNINYIHTGFHFLFQVVTWKM